MTETFPVVTDDEGDLTERGLKEVRRLAYLGLSPRQIAGKLRIHPEDFDNLVKANRDVLIELSFGNATGVEETLQKLRDILDTEPTVQAISLFLSVANNFRVKAVEEDKLIQNAAHIDVRTLNLVDQMLHAQALLSRKIPINQWPLGLAESTGYARITHLLAPDSVIEYAEAEADA